MPVREVQEEALKANYLIAVMRSGKIDTITRSEDEEEEEAFRGDLMSLPVNHVNVIPARRPRDVRDVCGE